MLNKLFILILGLLLISTISATAGMRGHSSGGHGSSHGGSTMKHMDHMMENGAEHNGHNNNQSHQEMDQSMANDMGMSMETARKSLDNYMAKQKTGMYHIGDLNDHGTTFTAEVHSHEGKLIEKVSIDKKSGNIHSLLNKDSETIE